MRPEETAPVVRAAIENNLIQQDQLTKLYYIGPMFRYERPQMGRQRQFHQAGIEVFGSDNPAIDVEGISLAMQIFNRLGISNLEVDLNSVGCNKCRPEYFIRIKSFFKDKIKSMCEDCQKRFETNPLRILDCKEPNCQKFIEKAPAIKDILCPECKTHFEKVITGLESLKIKYKVNNRLVRGLDYYTCTAFEIVSGQLGAQNAVCGGGRYDTLVEEFGGPKTAAFGFAIGLERVVEIIKSTKSNNQPSKQAPSLYVATMGDEAEKIGFELVSKARGAGISADMDYLRKSLKAQMKTADNEKAKYVLIIGDDEIKKNKAILKNMQTGGQEEIAFDEALHRLTS